jgi:hypothetical protein
MANKKDVIDVTESEDEKEEEINLDLVRYVQKAKHLKDVTEKVTAMQKAGQRVEFLFPSKETYLNLHSIHSVVGENWLDDDIINIVAELVLPKDACWISTLLSSELPGMQHRIKNTNKKILSKLPMLRGILIPKHKEGNHWILYVITINELKEAILWEFEPYDRVLPTKRKTVLEHVPEAMRLFLTGMLSGTDITIQEHRVVHPLESHQQTDNKSCGLYVCTFLQMLSSKATFSASWPMILDEPFRFYPEKTDRKPFLQEMRLRLLQWILKHLLKKTT